MKYMLILSLVCFIFNPVIFGLVEIGTRGHLVSRG